MHAILTTLLVSALAAASATLAPAAALNQQPSLEDHSGAAITVLERSRSTCWRTNRSTGQKVRIC